GKAQVIADAGAASGRRRRRALARALRGRSGKPLAARAGDRAVPGLGTAPDLARDFEDELELAPRVVLRHGLPRAAAAREAALRREAEALERHELRRFVDAPLEVVLLLELGCLGRD